MSQILTSLVRRAIGLVDWLRIRLIQTFADRRVSSPRSIEDYQVASKVHLAWRGLANYYINYAGDGLPVDVANAGARHAFDSISLALIPRILQDVSTTNTEVNIFGVNYQMPVIIAPTAVHSLVTDDGEVATARAANAVGAGYAFNYALSSRRLSDVVGAEPKPGSKWLHLYMFKDRRIVEGALRLAAATKSFSAVVVTVDHPHNRVQNLMLPILAKHALELPSQLVKEFMPNVELALGQQPRDLITSNADPVAIMDPAVTWADIKWICSLTNLPVVVKGVLSTEDALAAVEAGAKGIVVSNHGFRQMAGTVPAITALPSIAAAVGSRAKIFVDSGIRRSTDVLKALALGATAVLIGRPPLWALSVGGQSALEHMLQQLKQDIYEDMQSLGCKRATDINSSFLHKSGLSNSS